MHRRCARHFAVPIVRPGLEWTAASPRQVGRGHALRHDHPPGFVHQLAHLLVIEPVQPGLEVAAGCVGLTTEGVAARAGTGKAPLYRRWRSKDEFILDTVRQRYPHRPRRRVQRRRPS